MLFATGFGAQENKLQVESLLHRTILFYCLAPAAPYPFVSSPCLRPRFLLPQQVRSPCARATGIPVWEKMGRRAQAGQGKDLSNGCTTSRPSKPALVPKHSRCLGGPETGQHILTLPWGTFRAIAEVRSGPDRFLFCELRRHRRGEAAGRPPWAAGSPLCSTQRGTAVNRSGEPPQRPR